MSTFRYQSVRCDADLREKLVELAREKPRFGYRRLHVLLRRDGEPVNHKRVWRVYREAGLCVKRRKRKRLVRAGMKPAIVIAANQEWALDFAADVLATGRTVRVLGVVDTFTRECLALRPIPASPAAASRACWSRSSASVGGHRASGAITDQS